MHVAVQTILIFFFVAFPGVVFRRFYFRGEFSKQFDSKGWSHSLFLSLIIGLFIHLILISTYYCNGFLIDIVKLKELLYSYEEMCIPDFSDGLQIGLGFWYLGLLYFIPLLTGLSLYFFVRYTRLDIFLPIFRFQNYWHYYFTGEVYRYKHFKTTSKRNKQKVKFTYVNALVKETESTNTLISGFLSQYTINRNTRDLEYIYLSRPKKTTCFNTSIEEQEIDIKSNIMALPRERIININLLYLREPKSQKNYSKLYKSLQYFAYSVNLLEFFTIVRYGLEVSLMLKIIGHLFCFFLANVLTMRKDKEFSSVSKWGFRLGAIISIAVYFIIIKTFH